MVCSSFAFKTCSTLSKSTAAVLYSTHIPHCTPYCTVQYCTVLYCTVLRALHIRLLPGLVRRLDLEELLLLIADWSLGTALIMFTTELYCTLAQKHMLTAVLPAICCTVTDSSSAGV